MYLSIIIPVYNSENILENLINKIHESFNKRLFTKNFEVIYVNNFILIQICWIDWILGDQLLFLFLLLDYFY